MQIHLFLKSYFISHIRNCIACLGQIWREPWNSCITIIVIGIALALPTGLMVLLLNLQKINATWHDSVQISVFLHKTADKSILKTKEQQLQLPIVKKVEYISAKKALQTFAQATGQTNVLENLDENPIPPTLVISVNSHASMQEVEALMQKIQQWPEAQSLQLDKSWLQRLSALFRLADAFVNTIMVILAFAVFLITSNTISLNIEKRRKQIIITKLIGATNSFIRREFLYLGFWYGLLGSLVAWTIVNLWIAALKTSANELALLYSSNFSLLGLDLTHTCMLLVLSLTLCISAAWVAVGRYLDKLELE